MTHTPANAQPPAARSLWRLINRPQDVDRRAMRLACWAFLIVYATIVTVRFEVGQGVFLGTRLAVCAYAALGIWISRRFSWSRLRAYTVGVGILLPLQAAYVDGVMGNHLSEVAISALATFTALVFLQTGWDLLVVDLVLIVGHGVLLAVLPDPAVGRATAGVVLGGALASGSIAALVTLIYRGRWGESLAELTASEERFRSLSVASPVGIFQTDAAGAAVYVNARWGEIAGIRPEDGLGDGWIAAVHPDDRDALVRYWQDAARRAAEGAREFRMVTPRGEVRWVHACTKPMLAGDGRLVGHVGTVEDISERKRAEALREEDARTSAALARVGRELISSLETPKLLERLCELATDVLGSDCSLTWLRQPDEQVYTPISQYGLPPHAQGVSALRLPASGKLLARLEQEDVVQVRASSAEYPLTARVLADYGFNLALCIALRRGSEVIGVQAAGCWTRAADFTPSQERIARGIGQLASMALTNARLVEELERASRLKSEFVSTMSHELRTPLNVILGYADMLADDIAPGERAAMLVQIRKASLELLEMIEATLDLNRITAGKDAPRFEPVPLQGLWEELGSDFNALPAKPGVVVRWESVDGLELVTDRRKLKIVLKNLVGNALKFTTAGEIVVSVRRDAAACEFTVRDTGIGIPREHLPLIFEMFRQVDSSDRRSYGGAGLGLYIVCRLLEQLGGQITVASEPGVGSTFVVTLPARSPVEHAEVAAA